jgi:hypothetical protein
VYAKWTAVSVQEITVTFDLDGGTFNGSITNPTRTVKSGASIGNTNMPTPRKDEHDFGGWYTQRNGGGTQFSGNTTVTASITTVYARWTAVSAPQQVTYDANGGTGTVPAPQPAGANVTLASGDGLTSVGRIFTGWNTEPNGTGDSYYAGKSYTTFTTDTKLYAEWMEGGAMYELKQNNGYDNYVYNATDFLPSDFSVNMGDQITVSFDIKTDTYIGDLDIVIADNRTVWTEIAQDFSPGQTIAADGRFYSVNWTLTAKASTSMSEDPLVFQFAMDKVKETKVTIYVKNKKIVTTSPDAPLSLTQLLENIAAESGDKNYTITLNDSESIGPQMLDYSGRNVNITLNGGAAEKTVSLNSSGSLFTVDNNVTLTLGNNVTLQGRSNNTDSLVVVKSGGELIMNDGSKITENIISSSSYSPYSNGGGVFVDNYGTFEMNGGEISNNTAPYGGGVEVAQSGTFRMSGGTISNNRADNNGGAAEVYGRFEMSGGTINGNTAGNLGGGVFVVSNNGMFTISGGIISNNTGNLGGGVYVESGTFIKSGGTISDNTASSDGGGVFIDGNGAFEMSGGTISSNTASYGGGVYVANSSGGGVYVPSGVFIKLDGGTIYGSDAVYNLKNTADSNHGHAVYISGSPAKIRNSTAGNGDNLHSRESGTASDWEDPASTSPEPFFSWNAADDSALETLYNGEHRLIGNVPLTAVSRVVTAVTESPKGYSVKDGRFVIGSVGTDATAASNTSTDGVLDLSAPFRITIVYASMQGTGFQVYLNNNTSNQANSALGSASRIWNGKEIETGSTIIIDVYPSNFTQNIGTLSNGFISLRADSNTTALITSITLKHIIKE